jgi:hypothetical protein
MRQPVFPEWAGDNALMAITLAWDTLAASRACDDTREISFKRPCPTSYASSGRPSSPCRI